MTRIAVILCLLILFAGCGTPGIPQKMSKMKEPQETPRKTSQPASAATTKKGSDNAEVRLRPGLLLDVTVMATGKKEVDEVAKRVSDSGSVTLPLVGTLKVDGFTLEKLAATLTQRYRDYFVDPQVVVEFSKSTGSDVTSPWGYVTVMGRVLKQGRINIPPTRDLTVSGAVQLAGGLSTSARDSAIRVSRRKLDGTTEVREIDLRSVGSYGKFDEDMVLISGDVVFVPEKVF